MRTEIPPMLQIDNRDHLTPDRCERVIRNFRIYSLRRRKRAEVNQGGKFPALIYFLDRMVFTKLQNTG
jgi:hypothetical protein